MAMVDKETNSDSARQQSVYKWNEDITKVFIRLRMEKDDLFTGRRNSSIAGWNIILEQLGIHTQVTPEQARKKWTNLCQKYKEIRVEPLTLEPSEINSNWPYIEDLDRYFLVRNGISEVPSSGDPSTITFDPATASTIKLTYDPATASLTYATTPQPSKTSRKPVITSIAKTPPSPAASTGLVNRFRKRKRPCRSLRTVQNNEEQIVGLLHESLGCLRSMQESLRSQSDALITLLTELVRQKSTPALDSEHF